MINSTDEYKRAIVGDSRRILVKAIVDIIDPDISYKKVQTSGESIYSNSDQIHNKNFNESAFYVTLEKNRWGLNGGYQIYPLDVKDLEVGFMSNDISGGNGYFETPQWVELSFSNVSILQACSVYFLDSESIPENFSVEVRQGDIVYYSKEFVKNTNKSISLSGFTVYNPDAIRVTVTKMSLPYRRFRTAEIIPGIYEEWDGSILASFDVKHQGDVSCVSIPYGTCTLRMDNLDRRFEPRSKSGVFQSLEDRQGIDVSLAVRLEDGKDEYKRVGIYYQHSGGWKTGDNGLTMQWNLVDIVGLLADREFMPTNTLPTTLEGWVSALVSQLGENFKNRYSVDPSYSSVSANVREQSDVVGMKCGDLLRYVCMATGTWPRADAETGYLAVEPLWSEGNKITLRNLESYPIMKANEDIAAIIFTLNDGENTQYIVSGNSLSSSETKSINNPFIHTKEQALIAAKQILAAYGGNRYELVGRGDPTSEIGDVDTIWLNESVATTARRIFQTFNFQSGILRSCQSRLLQADGSFLYENRHVMTESGTWTAPAGVTSLRIILVGKGADGTDGTDGGWLSAGIDGIDGVGGKVWAGTISINDGQTFDVSVGENTVFGSYSSANGIVFPYGYTDVASGDSFARTGVSAPIAGFGDGGKGGKGGMKGYTHTEIKRVEKEDPETGDVTVETTMDTVIDSYPTNGTLGVSGAFGCAVVYWDV